ncbi:MAG: PKD domain-containing protein [Crocinitomicaceae bacterium]|nr:PKD domain-containing protein [Crocinitomicaceae bacterium]
MISSLKEQLISQVFPENEIITPKSFNGPCVNMDFEEGDLNGWTLTKGKVDGTVPYSFTNGVSVGPGASHLIVSGTGNDPVIAAIPMVNPSSGNFSCRLGDGIGIQSGAARMSQTFLVTPSNSILTYSYAVVFEDPNHTLQQQPYFSVRVFDENGNNIPCGSYSVIAGNNATASGFSQQGNVLYKNWTTIFSPLNAYIGQNVTVEFTTGDCSLKGHYGYAYIDASCNTFDITTSTGDTVICTGDNITLYAPQGGSDYLWNTGETTSTINVNQPGQYSVNVIPFQGSLCAISIDINIVGVPVPVSDFEFEPVCLGESINFTDLSVIDNPSTIASWNWNFGGTNTSTQQNPTFTFTNSGTHTVSLTTSSPEGCSHTISKSVAVMPLPNVSFTAPNVCDGSTSNFTNSSTIDLPSVISSYAWDVENDGAMDYTSENTSHVFTHGSYQTKLIVTSDFGCVDSLIQQVVVHPMPVADFSVNPVCFNETTVFQDLSYLIGTGNITSWNWDFGDGNSSTDQNPSHVYATSNTFTTTLEVTTNNGCIHSTPISTIVNDLPVAAFTFVNGCFNTEIQFTETASSNSSTYFWDFGDGTNSTLQNPSHLYATAGDFLVKLLVSTGSTGCLDSITQIITTYPLPIPSFSAANTCISEQVNFNDQSSILAPATITNYAWSFGDGNTSNQSAPSNLFAAEGVYDVQLILTSNHGCIDSLSQQVTVWPLPIVDFNASTVCEQIATDFTDLSAISSVYSPNSNTAWNWNFGDGNSSNSQSASHLYATHGDYQVTLAVTSANNCIDSVTKTASIMPLPLVDFTVLNVCSPNSTSFTNASTIASPSSLASFAWDMENNNTVDYTTQNAQHQFTHGSYSTSLTATSDFGCVATISKSFEVYPLPTADFSAAPICFGNETNFQDLSTLVGVGSITDWNWDLGNGSTSILQEPVHQYATAGIFAVTLTVTSDNNCTNQITKNVEVYQLPVAAFTFNNGCFNTDILLTNASTPSNNLYDWEFGDGSLSALLNPAHQYALPGDYEVKLVTTTLIGACKDSISHFVSAYPLPEPAFVTANQCLNVLVNFNDQSSILAPATITNYAWSFGDGNTSNQSAPSNLFAAEGVYDVQLILTSNHGCIDSLSQQVTVWPLPIVDFNASTVCEQIATDFTDLSAISSVYSPNSNTAWNWNFGDGNSSNSQSASHLYATHGDYQVTLAVTSANNCIDSVTKTASIMPLPLVDFTVLNVCSPNSTSFTNASTIASPSSLASFAWDMENNNTVDYTTQNAQHQFTHGSYSTSLTATSDFGCVATISKSFEVYPLPTADFSAAPICFGNETNFQDLSTLVGVGSITDWNWDLGNGSTSILQEPVHQYATAGIFAVTLTVTSDNNCTNQITKNVEVYQLPVAAFTFNNGCFNTDILLTNASTPSNNLYDWEFGDGSLSALLNPAHQYALPGDYEVKLVTTTLIGACKDSISHFVSAYPLPEPAFVTANQCLNVLVNFNDQSSILAPGNITNYSWKFGNGMNSNQQNPSHIYTQEGVYETKLILTSNHGCIDSLSQQVTVWPLPIVDFLPTEVCLNFDTQFSDLTTISNLASSNNIVSWNWDFADGGISSLQNPLHTYIESGLYPVKLTAISNHGCQAVQTKGVYVFPNPTVSFTGNNLIGCSPVCFTLNSTSFIDNTQTPQNPSTISNYSWIFSNGTAFNTGTNPSYSNCFTNASNSSEFYDVTLIVTTNIGCKDSASASNYIQVNHTPTADFDFSPNAPTSLYTQLTTSNYSTNANLYFWTVPGIGNSSNFQPTFNIENTPPGQYSIKLYVETLEGCKDSLIKSFELLDDLIIYVPNAFTPDGNKLNNVFLPILSSGFDKYDYSLQIYDRWGELIFETDNYLTGWDGSYLDKPVQDGTYVWKIYLKESSSGKKRVFHGHVSLIK